MKPVAEAQRDAAWDAARGAAVLGLAFVNIRHFAFPFAGELYLPLRTRFTGAEGEAFCLVALLAEFKFLSILSLLFGAGLELARRRWEGGPGFARFFRKRLAVLGLIGLVHGTLIWFGDILCLYALAGWAAYLLRNLRAGSLARLGAALVIGGGLLAAASLALAPEAWPRAVAALIEEQRRLYASGPGPAAVWGARLYLGLLVLSPLTLGPRVLGLFLLGMAVVRSEGVDHLRRAPPAAAALILGLVLEILALRWDGLPSRGPALLAAQWLAHYFGSLGVAFAYLSAILRLRPERLLFRLLACAGRMALTNYLLQSVFCAAIFFPWGMGLFGTVPLTACLALAVGLTALQASASLLWLRAFAFGPLEWLARGWAYGAFPSLRAGR